MVIQDYDTIPSELEKLSRFLDTNRICKDPSKISEASGKWSYYKAKKQWGYEIEDLVFNVDDIRHDMPHDIGGAELTLDITVKGDLVNNAKGIDDAILKEMQISIFIRACKATEDGCIEEVATSWHIDFHNEEVYKIRDAGKEEDNNRGCHHPLFHIQHGGNKLTEFRDDQRCDFGNYFLLKSPRWECQPFDAVLIIDHILSNYLCETWRKIKDEEEYKNLIEEATNRYVMPFYAQKLA